MNTCTKCIIYLYIYGSIIVYINKQEKSDTLQTDAEFFGGCHFATWYVLMIELAQHQLHFLSSLKTSQRLHYSYDALSVTFYGYNN